LESSIHFSRRFFCSGHGRNLFLRAVLQVSGRDVRRFPARKRARWIPAPVCFLPLLKLRIVCEPKGLPFMVSSITTSFEMPGQVRGLNYVGECRAGAFMAHP